MMFDPHQVRALLVTAAREGRAVSYSELLNQLGHPFTRPKMRAVCTVLGAIDAEARGREEPELAVLVVRESDALPGQGWWVAGPPARDGYDGPWRGREARDYVKRLQEQAFAYWQPGLAVPRPHSAGAPDS